MQNTSLPTRSLPPSAQDLLTIPLLTRYTQRTPPTPRQPKDPMPGQDFLVAFTMCFIVWTVFSSVRRYLIAKTKANLQEKVLQRIDSSEALASLAANESGRRFLESITVEDNHTRSPSGRILFGIQAGFVLLCFGIALVVLYHHIDNYGNPGLMIIGTGAIGLGLGFLTASVASLVVSRRLGLISPAPRDIHDPRD